MMSRWSLFGWNRKYCLLLCVVSCYGFLSSRFYSNELNILGNQYTCEFLPSIGIHPHYPINADTPFNTVVTEGIDASSGIVPEKSNVMTPYSGNLTFLHLKAMLERDVLSVDYDFARRLREVQTNNIYPLVNDIVVSRRSNSWAVYVIINNGNANNQYKFTSNTSVVLFVGNKTYQNVFEEAPKRFLRVLKYNIDTLPPVGTLSLYDYSLSFAYNDLPYVALRKQPKRRMAVCAYISNYNSINEIKSWLAFYLLQKIDAVILYCTVNYQVFRDALKMKIASGFVYLYEFPWPLTKIFSGVQFSVQGSHINSCYYRHRDYFQYIISQDVDEYLYSETYPYDLYKATQQAFALFPDASVLVVS